VANDKLQKVQQGYNDYASGPITLDSMAPGLKSAGQAISDPFLELRKRILQKSENMPIMQPRSPEEQMQDFRERQDPLPNTAKLETINPEVADQADLYRTLSEFGQLDPEQAKEQERMMRNKMVRDYINTKGK